LEKKQKQQQQEGKERDLVLTVDLRGKGRGETARQHHLKGSKKWEKRVKKG